jgi:hypothetical protein
MKNITFSADERLIEAAREQAAAPHQVCLPANRSAAALSSSNIT